MGGTDSYQMTKERQFGVELYIELFGYYFAFRLLPTKLTKSLKYFLKRHNVIQFLAGTAPSINT